MTYIGAVPEESAEGQVGEMYQRQRRRLGYVPNYIKAFSHRPELYEAWSTLISTIMRSMDARRFELATTAAAALRRSSYCTLAHGERLLGLGVGEDDLRALANDPASANLDDVERAVVQYAAKVAEAPDTVTAQDIEHLRSLGLSNRDVFDIASAVAARLFFTAITDAVGARPDAAYRERMPGLVEDLAVGRPVEEPEGAPT